MKNILSSTKKYVLANKFAFVYMILAILMEFVAQAFAGARLYIVHFWLPIMVLTVVMMILLALRDPRKQGIWATFFLIVQAVLIFIGVFLFNANGSAFQHEMFNMRNDAFATLEFIDVQPILIAFLLTTILAFVVFRILVLRYAKSRHQHHQTVGYEEIGESEYLLEVAAADGINPKKGKKKRREKPPPATKEQLITIWTKRGIALLVAIVFACIPTFNGLSERRQPNYHFMLTRMSGDNNQMRGVTTNFLYETIKMGSASGINLNNIEGVADFLIEGGTALTSDFHGVSAGNNLVMILAESFDFIALERYSEEMTRELFPNIMRLADGGISATNFRVKEKTDTAEALSLLGHNPSQGFVHYDFARNQYPFSLPNKMRQHFNEQGLDNYQIYSFHQNRASFYNRHVFHPSVGFQRFFGIRDMLDFGVIDTWGTGFLGTFGTGATGERTLDSQTVYKMRDVMFPVDRPFFTYWISFVKHGFYRERNNLMAQGYFARLDELGMFPDDVSGSTMHNQLRTYAAAMLDFDKSLGYMFEDLEQKGLLDTTTIIVVSDHEAYYHNLSANVRGVTHRLDPEAFRIPLMLYCRKLVERFDYLNCNEDGEPREITKFTTMQDLVPTILDIFGIIGWRNIYLGETIFRDDVESIVFSRVYKFFFNDRLAFFNKNHIDFLTPEYQDGDLNIFLERAKIHLDRLFWIDRIYFGDFFRDRAYILPN